MSVKKIFCNEWKESDMNVKGIIWLGTRTSKFESMLNLYQNIMGMKVTYQERGFVVMDLPNGDRVEVFGDDSPYNTIFTSPVAGFLVDDIESARAEMEAQGIEFIGPIESANDGNAWTHFRAPDGFIYELTYTPDHPSMKE
jgi:catechol 2,3-dioxygenase-like lactoylglutathione lyase family enzyme